MPYPFSKNPGKAGLAIARVSPPVANVLPNVDRPPDSQRMKPQEGDRVLLFQYGSNMSQQRLEEAVHQYVRFAPDGTPLDLRLVGAARLEGWKLVFDLFSVGQLSLVADIHEAGKADEVWGSLYELSRELVIRSDGRRSVLDRIEGHRTERGPENYTLVEVVVEADGKRRSALAYVGTDDARRRCRADHEPAEVAASYASSILNGAAAIGLPEQYFHRLEKQIAASGPKGRNE